MSGPYPPEYGAGPVGPQMYPGSGPESFPQQSHPGAVSGERRIGVSGHAAAAGAVSEEAALATDRRRLLAVLVVAATVAAIVLATRGRRGISGIRHT